MSLILKDLPPSTHLFPYRGSAAFLETCYREFHRFSRDQTVPDFVVFTDVDEKQFDEDFRNSSDKDILHSISTYDPTQHVLIAKMTSAAHAAALERFGAQLLFAIRPQNLYQTLGMYGGQLFDGQGQSKKADKAWGPCDRTRHQGQRRPTVVAEVAVSETRTKLWSSTSAAVLHTRNGRTASTRTGSFLD